MGQKTGQGRGIKATETTFAIIEIIQESGQIYLTEIANQLDIANSTASAHLSTLKEFGYIIEESDGYRLGLKFLDHGMQARFNYQHLLKVSEPVLQQLVEETQEAVNLVVEEDNHAVFINRLTGNRGVPTNSWTGKRKRMHTLSTGKAILAHLSSDRIDEIIAEPGLVAETANTITTRETLEERLEEIRDRGVAFNNRESHQSIRAVGTPIILDETVYGAISVAGPARRFTGEYFETEIPDLLLGAVNEIELKLAYE